MTQFNPNTMAASRAPGRPNVYTLMLLIAFLALVTACIYVVFRHHTLFGNWNVFDATQSKAVALAAMFTGMA